MTVTRQPETLETLAERVDRAMAEVRALDAGARDRAIALKQAIEAFHKAGLTTIIQRLKADPRGKELLFELVDDPLVYALFAMHGLVRLDLATRVARVLEQVRPFMQSHGGDVELVEVREATVFVHLHGACNGCSMSAVTLREGVEEAILSQIPEIREVEVLPNEPGPALIRPEAISVRAETGWTRGPRVEDVPPGTMVALRAGPVEALIINLDHRLSAFRNACAHQGLPLDGGLLDPAAGTLTCPWHGFCFDAGSGECLTAPQAQLEPFPLRVEEGVIWVRLAE
ncbi:MAG: NifU family protein [Oscillochloridaceae bacterium]|nr:NifU family protein [Chloroflexaceae bacterium]MDW8390789.1 NifU family protein [Oscillochloridaceae bacterium]